MKVYLSTHGSYDDYMVIGVFSKREEAEDMNIRNGSENDVEEFELDDPVNKPTDVNNSDR